MADLSRDREIREREELHDSAHHNRAGQGWAWVRVGLGLSCAIIVTRKPQRGSGNWGFNDLNITIIMMDNPTISNLIIA